MPKKPATNGFTPAAIGRIAALEKRADEMERKFDGVRGQIRELISCNQAIVTGMTKIEDAQGVMAKTIADAVAKDLRQDLLDTRTALRTDINEIRKGCMAAACIGAKTP